MKHISILIVTVLVLLFASCRPAMPARPHHVFVVPAYKVRHHWGAPKHFTLYNRYWGRHRYGPRPHRQRGHYHY